MQYRNTPIPDINLSPSQILFHRQQRDHLPSHPTNYKLHENWLRLANQREELLFHRNTKVQDAYNAHAHNLPPLTIGTLVRNQNQGPKGNKQWSRTGKIVEVLPHRQYQIRVDGSGRITKRNHRFLKPYIHNQHTANNPIPSHFTPTPTNITHTPNIAPAATALPQPYQLPVNMALPPRIPRALKNLQSYNKPGLLEQIPLPRH